MAITTNGLQLARIAGAVFNQQLSASDYSEILAANKTAAELDAWANAAVAAEFRNKTTTDIAKAVLANVGLSSVAGLENWVTGQLNAGGGLAKAGATMLAMLNDYSNMSTSDATYGASVVTFNAKTANSQALSQTAGTPTGTYAAVSAVPPAKTFTLTTGTDNVVGTSGGDTIDGQLNASGSQTYSAADAIDGGAGEDALVIRVGAGTYVASSLKNVETVSVQATGAAVLNVVNSSGIKTLKNAASSDTVEFRAVDAATAVEIANTASANTVTYKSASLSGTSDSASIKVDGLTGALTVADVDASLTDAFAAETIALTSTGTANTIATLTLTSLGATKLTVAGEANLTVTNRLADATTGGPTVKTIDASAATGNINISGAHNTASQAGNTITGGSGNDTLGGGDGNDVISGGAGNDSITAGDGVDNLTGGAGNDTFDLAGNLTSSDTVDGGDGTDTLVSTGAITGTSGSKVSGIETVSTSAAVEISAAAVSGVATLRSTQDAGGTTTFSNMAGTETINIRTAAGGNDNVTGTKAVDGTADSQIVTIGNSSGSTPVVLGTLTLNDAETISITSSLVANTIGVLTSADATKLNIAGSVGLTISAFTSSAALKTIDASAATAPFIMGAASAAAAVTITGGTGNDTLIGSTGNDVINGGDGVDSIQIGGAGGNDSMVGGSGNDTFISINAITTDITANDSIAGGDGTDTLQFGSGTDGQAAIDLTGAGILANVSGIERIVLADTDTAQTLTIDDNMVGIAGGTLTVTTLSGVAVASTVVNNTLSSTSKVVATQAVAQTLNYTLGNSIDDVTGNTAADAFTVGTSAYLSATDAIRGGAGADTITFSGAAAGVFTAAQLSGISSVETFTVDTAAGSEAYRFTLNDTVAGNNFSGTAFTVSRAAEAGTLNVQGQLVSYALALTGGTAADTLVGGTGNDTIAGRADSAIDNLTGGAGNDIFHLDDGAIDVITDFSFGTSSTSVDVLLADISDIARDATLLLDTDLDTITTGAASAAVAATDVLVVTAAVYADAAAVDTALEANTALMTHDYLVIYQDTFGSIRVALADVTTAQNANNTADVTVVDLVQLTGLSMSTISTLISLTDFTFQA